MVSRIKLKKERSFQIFLLYKAQALIATHKITTSNVVE
jgi:hypothetical protein